MTAVVQYTRETIQAVLARAMNNEVKRCAVPGDQHHMKVLVEAVLRIAVLQALRLHMPVQEFAALAVNAYVGEITEGKTSGSHMRMKKVSCD